MGGGKTLSTSPTKAEALTLQSSVAGATIPWLRGQHRLPANLVWYGDFKATAHQESQGGKGGGGGGGSTSYTYSASLVMLLCHGTITAIPTVWNDKSATNLGALGMSMITGTIGQLPASVLAPHGVQKIGYSALAGISAAGYALGDSPSVPNHSFEVRHSSAFSVVGTTPDVDPTGAAADLLTDAIRGAGLPAGMLGDWTQWSDYCVAQGLLMSPLLTEQTQASDALQTIVDLTNAACFWSEGKLKVLPYGDQALTGNGRTYTPNTTPVYELDDTCFIFDEGEAPISVAIKTGDDRFNTVNVQYKDRSNGYNVAIATAKDLTDISVNGERVMDTITADWICDVKVARLVAEIKKQRSLLVVGEYTFRLPWHYALVECMDLLTLTDSVLMIDDLPVRVTKITEASDEELEITCEDYPAGMASAPLYPAQVPAGFSHDANASPGDALAPVIFELPGPLTTTGLELGIATAGASANWGGCQVWVSYDGTNYRQLAQLNGPSRFGLVATDSGSSLGLSINAGEQLIGGSSEDAENLATLMIVGDEYLAYEDATLTGPGAYSLTGLVRGAYGTPISVHASGTPWARADDRLARSGPLDVNLVGKSLYIKLCSFNVYGAGQQSLADVDPVSYTITGNMIGAQRAVAALGIRANQDTFTHASYSQGYIHGFDGSGSPQDVPGRISVNGVLQAVANGVLKTSQGPVAAFVVWDQSGTGFAMTSGTRPYVMARRTAADWEYDNDSVWTAFTPTGTHYIVGTVETGDTDTGSAPGIVAAAMWVQATTLDAMASVGGGGNYLHLRYSDDGGTTFTADHGKTPGAYLGQYVDFDEADSEDPTDYIWVKIAGTDGTPGTPGADGQTPYFHTKYSNDGGTTFTGGSGELPGAYLGTCTDFTMADPTTVGAYTWALIKGADGTNGTPGAAGSNGQTSYLHIKWSNDGGSTFTASSGETPGAYIGTCTDFNLADPTTVGAYIWALVKGANGTDGIPGTPGSDGLTSYLHVKWSNDGGSTFTASSGETPGSYIGTCTDFNVADPTTVGAYVWALVKGSNGTNGTNGANGADAITIQLSRYAATVPADSSGVVTDWSAAVTVVKVLKGSTDDTANWSLSRTNGSGVTSTLSGTTLTVSAVTGDAGTVDITATRSGFATLTASFSVSKAKSAVAGTGVINNTVVTSFVTHAAPATAGVKFNADGTVTRRNNAGTYVATNPWYSPTTSGIGSSYWIKLVPRSGAATLSAGTINSVLALSSTLTWEMAIASGASTKSGAFDYYLFSDSGGLNTVATGTISMSVDTT